MSNDNKDESTVSNNTDENMSSDNKDELLIRMEDAVKKVSIQLSLLRAAIAQVTNQQNPYLPQGIVQKVDSKSGRIFYVNHNTKTTSWNHPITDFLNSKPSC